MTSFSALVTKVTEVQPFSETTVYKLMTSSDELEDTRKYLHLNDLHTVYTDNFGSHSSLDVSDTNSINRVHFYLGSLNFIKH